MENKERIVRKIANRVSKRYSLYPPVDFKNVFVEKGIKYREKKLETNGDGYSELKDSNLEIVVNSEMDYMPRKRFTIAHELGHIFIGWHDDVTLCKTDNEYAAHNMLDIQEKEANVFASELLMPTEWVREQLEKYKNFGLDYVIKKLYNYAETSVMACFYALENAMPEGNVFLVFTPSIYWRKKFISNNTEICYLPNLDFQERCEILCIEKSQYTIASYDILHYRFLPRPTKNLVEETYTNSGNIIDTIKILSKNHVLKWLHNFSYAVNCIKDRYAVWVFQDDEELLFCQNHLLEMEINRQDMLEAIVQRCNHYGYFYEYEEIGDSLTVIALKEPIYKDVQAWKESRTDSRYLCNQILNDIYIGKELEDKRRVISGIIGSANSMHKDFSVEELYNLIQKRMRRVELDDFVNHSEFNRFVSLKSFELVNRKNGFS